MDHCLFSSRGRRVRSRGEGSGKEREREKGKVGRVPLIWDWKKNTGGWVDPTPVKKKLEDGWKCMGRGDEMSLPPGFVKLFVLHVGSKGVVCEG